MLFMYLMPSLVSVLCGVVLFIVGIVAAMLQASIWRIPAFTAAVLLLFYGATQLLKFHKRRGDIPFIVSYGDRVLGTIVGYERRPGYATRMVVEYGSLRYVSEILVNPSKRPSIGTMAALYFSDLGWYVDTDKNDIYTSGVLA